MIERIRERREQIKFWLSVCDQQMAERGRLSQIYIPGYCGERSDLSLVRNQLIGALYELDLLIADADDAVWVGE